MSKSCSLLGLHILVVHQQRGGIWRSGGEEFPNDNNENSNKRHEPPRIATNRHNQEPAKNQGANMMRLIATTLVDNGWRWS